MSSSSKIALVTGAAAGLGKAIAERFAKGGMNCVISDLDLTKAEEVATAIKQQYGVETLALAMDVSDKTQVDLGFQAVHDKWGKLDVLVNNAGIQIIASIVDFDFAAWQKMLAIHLSGSFLTTQAAMRMMKQQATGGSLLYIGSVHSYEASLEKSAYVAAKHGLLGLMRAAAKEGAPFQIKSNLVAPGFVKTALVEKQIPEQAKALGISEADVVKRVMLGHTLDGEFTTVEEVAETCLFLANFEGLALTGQSIPVTHGWHMQ